MNTTSNSTLSCQISRKSKVYIALTILCILIVTSDAAPYSKHFWQKVRKCRGIVFFKCKYISHYCNPRMLVKRSVDNEDINDSTKLVMSRRSKRKGFHVTCQLCHRFCW
ncbi:uncharacterized protein LOC100181000 [Ciona intestinalis]